MSKDTAYAFGKN